MIFMRKVLFFSVALIISAVYLSSCKKQPVKTIENLKTAFNGESTASKKYNDYAAKARTEGLDTIAKLFDAASKAESIHAENHKAALEKLGEKVEAPAIGTYEVKSTKENLEDAIKGESYEVETMYAEFLKIADQESCDVAKKTFTWASDTEKKHTEYYNKALNALNNADVKSLSFQYFVCPKCGNTFESNNVDEKCGFCMTPKEKYIEI